MTDQTITFETAKLAKEKGFSLPMSSELDFYTQQGNVHPYMWFKPEELSDPIYAPTQCLLQKWLREKHGIHIYIETTPAFDKTQGNKWRADVKYCFQPFKWTTGHYYLRDTYEDALEIGLQESLKLIK